MLERLAGLIAERLHGPGPHLVGIAGPVAVGKTTVATGLAKAMAPLRVHVLSTDAFLRPNAVLDAQGLGYRKGFPETFDLPALAGALKALRSRGPVEVPVYSHAVYDILPGEAEVIEGADLVIVEGVIALNAAVLPLLDASVYVDAPEATVRGWFIDRLLGLLEAAKTDPSSFYAQFAGMTSETRLAFAEGVWDQINGVNLREHIGPTRAGAMFVVRKGPDHEMLQVVSA